MLWVLQGAAALLYGSSGVMKIFLFEKISAIGLILPAAFHWRPQLTILAATLLAIESLVFVWQHLRYREMTAVVLSVCLGLLMAFIAYGRLTR